MCNTHVSEHTLHVNRMYGKSQRIYVHEHVNPKNNRLTFRYGISMARKMISCMSHFCQAWSVDAINTPEGIIKNSQVYRSHCASLSAGMWHVPS